MLPNESHGKLSLVFLALLGEVTIVIASRLRFKCPIDEILQKFECFQEFENLRI